MDINTSRAFRYFALAVVFALAASGANAKTYKITTKKADGGFDGWCSTFWGNGVDNFGPDEKAETLNAGNLRPGGYDRSATIMMFSLGSMKQLKPEDIVSVVLSYYVADACGSPNLTIAHGSKAVRDLVQNVDNAQSVTNSVWVSIGIVSNSGKKIGSIDVTNSFLADLREGKVYSSFRIVQGETFENQQATFPYGSIIASSRNTSGYLVPTLTITSR